MPDPRLHVLLPLHDPRDRAKRAAIRREWARGVAPRTIARFFRASEETIRRIVENARAPYADDVAEDRAYLAEWDKGVTDVDELPPLRQACARGRPAVPDKRAQRPAAVVVLDAEDGDAGDVWAAVLSDGSEFQPEDESEGSSSSGSECESAGGSEPPPSTERRVSARLRHEPAPWVRTSLSPDIVLRARRRRRSCSINEEEDELEGDEPAGEDEGDEPADEDEGDGPAGEGEGDGTGEGDAQDEEHYVQPASQTPSAPRVLLAAHGVAHTPPPTEGAGVQPVSKRKREADGDGAGARLDELELPWTQPSAQQPKRVKLEPDSETPLVPLALAAGPREAARAASVAGEMDVDTVEPPLKTGTEAGSTLPPAAANGDGPRMDVDGNGGVQAQPHSVPSRTPTAAGDSPDSPDLASSVDPNDIMSPLTTPVHREPAGANEDDDIVPMNLDTKSPQNTVVGPCCKVSPTLTQVSLSFSGDSQPEMYSATQPLSRSDSASSQSTLVGGNTKYSSTPMRSTTTPHESDVARDRPPHITDIPRVKKAEDDGELDPDVARYIEGVGLEPRLYARRLALIGLTSGTIIAATRNFVSEVRKDRLEEDLRALSGLSVVECAVLISGLRRAS